MREGGQRGQMYRSDKEFGFELEKPSSASVAAQQQKQQQLCLLKHSEPKERANPSQATPKISSGFLFFVRYYRVSL